MGGHDVSLAVIEYNFNEGIKRVRASLHLFENLLFIDGTSDFGDIKAIHITKSGKHQITDHPASWYPPLPHDNEEKIGARMMEKVTN